MKNMAAMSLAVIQQLAESKPRLSRDVILAAVADEEAGSTLGSRFLVDHHPELVRAEFGLGEVGGFTLHILGRRFYPIMVAEKGACRVRVRTRGAPGHGSMPHPETAITKLGRALERLGSRRLPQHVTPTLLEWFRCVGRELPLPARLLLHSLRLPLVGQTVLTPLSGRHGLARSLAAVLSNTAAPTLLRGGEVINVLPAVAEADLDCRTLPGEPGERLMAELRTHLGAGVELELLESWPAVSVPASGPLWDAIVAEVRRADPGAVPVPYMIPGFTDAKEYSRLGTRFHGFAPVALPAEISFAQLFHGVDERIPEEGFLWGTRLLRDVVCRFAG